MKIDRMAMLYGLLKQSRTTKMEDKGRLKVLRIIKALRPAASEYEADVKEAEEKMKDEQFSTMTAKAEKWQAEGAKAITEDEKIAINAYFARYRKKVNEAVAAISGKSMNVELDKLSQDEFLRLINSNDYTGEQMELLDDTILNQEPVSVTVFDNK